ncbi:MAG TPA: RNA polymerase sigma-70 factor [Niabella sp.]|nr:RNA polymerase sigma-70 factor [Niabella sp.]
MEKDSHLYELLSKGDEAAFNHFFSMYREKVHHFVLLIVKAPEIAEEVTIDIFLKLWQKRSELPGINDMDAFLFIVAKRKAIDFLKKASKDKKIKKRISENWPEAAEETPDSYAFVEYKELLEIVLNTLPPQRKSILMLSRIDGLSHKEISSQLNISQNTVKNTISQTMKSLEPLKNKLWVETCWFAFLAALFF